MEEVSPERARPRGGSALVVVAAVRLIARAAPLAWAYVVKLRGLHAASSLALAAAAGLAALVVLTLGVWRLPRATAAGLAALGLVVALLAGNAAALLFAAGILAGTLLLGDLVARLLLGREPRTAAWDLASVLASGIVAAGLLVLALAQAGLLTPRVLAVVAVALVAARARRVPWFAARARRMPWFAARAFRSPGGEARPRRLVEAAWLAFASAVLLACWVAAQAPDTSWDALVYHLPEARDIAVTGRVEAAPELAPQSLLWHNHDAFLALGFLAGGEGGRGERVVSILQFAIGLAVFGAALALARRLGVGRAAPLIVLALAAFPPAMLQLHWAYVDWPAALLVTAAAAQLAERNLRGERKGAARRVPPGRSGRHEGLRALRAAGDGAARAARGRAARARRGVRVRGLPLAPWLLWSHRYAGSIVAPYADSPGELLRRAASGRFFTTSPASGAMRPAATSATRRCACFGCPTTSSSTPAASRATATATMESSRCFCCSASRDGDGGARRSSPPSLCRFWFRGRFSTSRPSDS